MALAHHEAGEGHRRRTRRLLLGVIACGLVFLLLKGIEYYLDYHEGMVPVVRFEADKITGAEPSRVELFLVFYYIMTGIHALHVSAGVGVWAVLAAALKPNVDLADKRNAIEMAGLYWHFVDIVWLYLLPLLYMVGTR